jgi:anti-anti-sigma factor
VTATLCQKGESFVPESDLAIRIDVPGGLIALSGRLSAATVAEVRATLTVAISGGTGDLVVDIAAVDLVDASGLGVLVSAHRLALRNERRLVLRNVPQRIERLLIVTHLNRVLATERVDDLDAAVSA